MTSKPRELSDLQRDLLHLAVQGPKAKIWLPKASQQAFPTTYAAIVSLQRRGLLDSEQAKDPEVLTWKVTKEGRDALKTPKPEPAPRKQTAPQPAPRASDSKAAPATGKHGSASAPAKAAAPRSRSAQSSETVSAKAGRSARGASAPAAEAPRERGGQGKKAVPAASPSRSTGKKAAAPVKKTGGRGRT